MRSSDVYVGCLCAGLVFIVGALCAAPVQITDVITSPGFGPEAIETNGQTLVYIKTSAGWYAPTGAVCTACASAGTRAGTEAELPEPLSNTSALSGLKYTQVVLNFGSGAKFNLGVTITNDGFGVVLGEIGTTVQTSGDPINVYPTTNGVRVGNWVLAIAPGDYGLVNYPWHVKYNNGTVQQDFRGFLTTFRLSDFTNDTGALSFDGIELTGNTGYDPNIVAVMGGLAPMYVPEVSHVLLVTGMTFSPGFTANPETNGQALVGITTAEGMFLSITGLTCVASTGVDWIDCAASEPRPATTNAALSGLKFTQMAANPDTVDYSLGFTISQDDGHLRFFVGEISTVTSGVIGSADPMIIRPLSNGVPVGDWKLEILAEAYGVASAAWDNNKLADIHFAGRLVSFAVTDFTGGMNGTFPNVNGFRIECGNMADPNIFGMYDIYRKGTLIRIQ